jgi:hypothetical protein
MKKNKSSTSDYCYYYFLSFLPVPHLYSAHLILLSTLAFRRRRKEIISTEDERVFHEEMKGFFLSVQFKAYCGEGEDGKLPS